jgi:hypothetical protein
MNYISTQVHFGYSYDSKIFFIFSFVIGKILCLFDEKNVIAIRYDVRDLNNRLMLKLAFII